MSSHWRFRLQRTFFGLTDKYMENIYEQFFYLKYVGNWSFIEAYNLPVGLRNWFVKRLAKQLKDENEQMDKASKGGSSSNSYELNSNTQSMLSQYGKPGQMPNLKGRS